MVSQAVPIVSWPAPAPITYGSPLGAGQLDATANVPGVLVYTPASGTVLPVGNGQTLGAVFTPSDTADYTSVSTSTTVNVIVSPCDPLQNGAINVGDVQRFISEALGVMSAANDVSGDGAVNVTDIQIALNAARGLNCTPVSLR